MPRNEGLSYREGEEDTVRIVLNRLHDRETFFAGMAQAVALLLPTLPG
jgi:hypothetical protein